MRDIKYRVWDKTSKCMGEVETIDFVNDEVTYHNYFYEDKNQCRVQDFKYCELMQFTGLLDKNGKPIFEGDIIKGYLPDYVKWNDKDYNIRKVEFHEYGYWLPFNDYDGCNETFWTDEMENGYEVIGNIYENPELLETKD